MKNNFPRILATFFWVGECPVAPGTLASAVGLVIAFVVHPWPIFYFVLMAAITVVGVWAAGLAEKSCGKKDPGFIVIDEVAGIMVSFFLVPLSWPVLVSGFFLFRAFDMFKIPPADKLEQMGGGFGIVADDIAAGLYTNIVLQVSLYLMYVIRW